MTGTMLADHAMSQQTVSKHTLLHHSKLQCSRSGSTLAAWQLGQNTRIKHRNVAASNDHSCFLKLDEMQLAGLG